mgnify:CR=1 FL=1
MNDVFITDHKPREQKFNTNSEEEDKEFFLISKAIEEYGKGVKGPELTKKWKARALDALYPLANHQTLDDGAKYLKI